ncbi:MAG: type II toxin-antitoxin system Phd/YefM family antitoxin [Chloroflexi bacterium]|nr:type II toxin-antitoxin system Phd/YefM family antitoxin [Chloroflexota bacterium]
MTRRISIEQAQAELPQLLDAAAGSGERVIIERPGKPSVVLVMEVERGMQQETPVHADSWLLALQSVGPVDYTNEDIDEMVADIYAQRYSEMGRPVDLGLNDD